MTVYKNFFKMMEDISAYSLKKGQRIRPCRSIKGIELGFCTAFVEPPQVWAITPLDLRESVESYPEHTRQFVLAYMLVNNKRREILYKAVRSGKLKYAEKDFVLPQSAAEVIARTDPRVFARLKKKKGSYYEVVGEDDDDGLSMFS